MSATAQKSTKWRFSRLNHQNFEFFGLVSKSPTQTGLICAKPWSRISQAWAAAKFPIDILFYRKGFPIVTVFSGIRLRIDPH
jgi:hypothetical protein